MSKFELSKPTKELSLGEILSLTFNLYLSHFSIFFTPFLILSIISALISLPMLSYVEEIGKMDFTGPADVVWNKLWNVFLTLIALAFITATISWVTSNIVSGVVIKSASDLIEKGKTSLSNSFNFAIHKLPSLLVASLIVSILQTLGLLLLIIPGIIIFTMFYLVIPAIIIEEKGAFDSLSRSRKLVSNRWLKTFALSLVVGLIIGVLAIIVGLILIPLGIYSSLASTIIISVIEPISPISSTFYYYSMRAREESERILPPPPPPF